MPVHDYEPFEVTQHIDGEGDIDPIIAQQVADDRAGLPRRELPRAFIEKVTTALEYTIHYTRSNEYDCCERRRRVDDWLESLRWGNRYDDWCNRLTEERVVETPEQTAAREAGAAAAKTRAEVLLRGVLSTQQLKELERRNYFHVIVQDRRFRITRGRSHNIKEVDGRGRILRTLCAHPVEYVPDADTMLAQKLWLESKPNEFFKLANVLRPRRRRGSGDGRDDNTRIERLVLDEVARRTQVAEQAREVYRLAEQQAREGARQAAEDVRILEQAARETASAGVDVALAPETTAAVRAA